nr:uncharacterized protein LOC102119988 isoform X1 [Macaca fascicularis]
MLMAQEALAFLAAQERRVLRATEVPRVQGQQGPRGREEAPHGCRVAVLLLHRMEAASAGPGGRKDAWFSWNITMPFSSPMEAELVRRVLSPDATPLPRPGAVLKDFTVSGNLLFMSPTDCCRPPPTPALHQLLSPAAFPVDVDRAVLSAYVFGSASLRTEALSPAWCPFLGRAFSPRGWSLHERPLHCGGLIVCRWRRPAYMFVSVGNKTELQFRV